MVRKHREMVEVNHRSCPSQKRAAIRVVTIPLSCIIPSTGRVLGLLNRDLRVLLGGRENEVEMTEPRDEPWPVLRHNCAGSSGSRDADGPR